MKMDTTEATKMRVSFSSGALDLSGCYNFVQSPKCGAINIFSGTIRDQDVPQLSFAGNPGRQEMQPIRALYYEAYQEMAEAQIWRIIAAECSATTGQQTDESENTRVCVAVRLGEVPVGESAIIIAASSTRRARSHQLVMSILARIKAEVVIWKKILFADGSQQWDPASKSEASWLRVGTQPQQQCN